MRRVTVRDASYTGPLVSLLQWSAAAWRQRRAARRRAAAAAPGTPGTPSGAHAPAAARLHLPVTLRGLHITVQARPATAAGCGDTGATPSPQPRTPSARFCVPGNGFAPATPPVGGLARSGSLLAPRQLLASGRWRLVARVARLLDITLADVSIDVLPAAPADAAAAGVQLRLRHVALSAGGAPGGAALRRCARAEGLQLRRRRRRQRGGSAGGAGDGAAAALDAASWEDATLHRSGAEAGTLPAGGAAHGADVAALAWLELGADVEHDAVAGATRCARLEADSGAAVGSLTPALAAALRHAPPAAAAPLRLRR